MLHVCRCPWRPKEGVNLELVSQVPWVAVNHSTQVLGTGLGSSGRAVDVLTDGDLSSSTQAFNSFCFMK